MSHGIQEPAAFVYRLVPRSTWDEFKSRGRIEASAIDRKDGFFHLSPREDVCETATLYFPGQDMMAIEWPTSVLGEGLRYEPVPARGDRLFPHLYGTLPRPGDATAEVLLTWTGERFIWPLPP